MKSSEKIVEALLSEAGFTRGFNAQKMAEFMGSLAITAVEGGYSGLSSWADIRNYNPSDSWDTSAPSFYCELRITRDDDGSFPEGLPPGVPQDWFKLTPALIRKGLQLVPDRFFKLIGSDRSDPGDWDYDVLGADAVVQYGVFGDLIFA